MKSCNWAMVLATAAASLTAWPLQAACLSDTEVATLFEAYAKRQPAPNPEGLSAADGECTRAKFNRLLQAQMGPPVGYKAGLTNPAVQKRFEHDAPVWGTLYGPMLLKSGASVDAAFGARPLYEADLLVRVSDEAINRAASADDVLRSIDQIIPFIELPDLVVQSPAPPKLNGAGITAMNVGARLGVLGTPIAVAGQAGLSDALRDFVAVVKNDGNEVDRGKGSDVLGHPLNAVVWLAKDMARAGAAMKKGDLISLGSFSKLQPPKPGLLVEVVYQGLPGNPSVSVSFK